MQGIVRQRTERHYEQERERARAYHAAAQTLNQQIEQQKARVAGCVFSKMGCCICLRCSDENVFLCTLCHRDWIMISFPELRTAESQAVLQEKLLATLKEQQGAEISEEREVRSLLLVLFLSSQLH